jgi:hypothetical protein
MTEPREPTRWLDAADADVAELLEGLADARADGPTTEQLARLRSAVASTTAPSSGGLALKLIAGGIVVIGALLGTLRLSPPERSEPSEPRAVQARPAAPQAPPAPVELQPPAHEPAPSVVSPEPPRPKKTLKTIAPDAERLAPSPQPDVVAELALLRRARAHVRSAPSRALELVTEHERSYGSGALVEEREVIAIEALLASGRTATAEQRAERFFEAYPRSAHARRIRALLAELGGGAFPQE